MAGGISAYTNPGVLQLVEKKARCKMQFSKPRDATNLLIDFFAVHDWASNGKTVTAPGAQAKLIGTIGGTLSLGIFKETSQAIPFPNDRVNALLTVDLDGELITMPLPNVDREKEVEFFEISFRVKGTVKGASELYESPTPIFVRRTPTPRAELAFIAGDRRDFANDPSTLAYFQLASQYWSRLQDNRSNEQSLAGISNFLREDTDRVVRARRNLPWGRINIVSHGNEDTWFIRSHIGDAENTAFTAESLKAEDLGVLGPPRPKEVDQVTEIIIRGCEIGTNVPMLNAIRDKFGGKATVFAPKFENNYRLEGGELRDRLFESWFFFQPGSREFPPPGDIASTLKRKYTGHPLYGGFTDDQWKKVAAITAPFGGGATAFRQRLRFRKPSDPTDTVTAEFDKDEVITGGRVKSQADLTALMRTQMASEIPGKEFDTYAWTWTVKQKKKTDPQDPPIFIVSGTGNTTLFEIFRLLTKQENGQTVPVTPNHLDPSQFGRSS